MKHDVITNVVHENKSLSYSYNNCTGTKGNVTIPLDAVVPGLSQEDIPVDVDDKWTTPYDHNSSWRKIRDSGIIKMTNYENGTRSIVNHLGTVKRNSYAHAEGTDSICCSGATQIGGTFFSQTNHSSWDESHYYSGWALKYPNLPFYKATIDVEQSQIEAAKTTVWSDLLHTYNLGEEVGEIRETVEFLTNVLRAAHHPLRTLLSIKRSLRNVKSGGKLFADAWMQYRYALMPLIYSTQDIMKVYRGSKDLYKTKTQHVHGSVRQPDLPSSGSYFYQVINYGSVDTKIMAKARWETARLQTLDQIGVNPITTAWELIPLSFVVDWFINVGDYVSANVESFTSLASQKVGCVAQRKSYQIDTFLHLDWDERYHWNFTWGTSSFCSGNVTRTFDAGEQRVADVFLIREEVNSYERVLFNRSDLELTVNPYLNWKRLIDGSILSLRFASKLLRALK